MLTRFDPFQLRQYSRDRFLEIESAKMIPVDAMLPQRADHLDSQIDTEIFNSRVVVLDRF